MSGFAGKLFRKNPVPDTAELKRILALPRRDWRTRLGGDFEMEELVELMTEAFKRPGGTMKLRPVQAAALAEMHDFGGFCGAILVGGGKTIVSGLAPKIFEAKRPLLLIPAALMDKTRRDFDALQTHWVIPEITIQSYQALGRVACEHFLTALKPDLIIADEAHYLANLSAGVSKRVDLHMRAYPETNFVALSGTFTRKSIREYWHILRWTLKPKNMPLPNEWGEMILWGDCLDADNPLSTTNVGALIKLCTPKEKTRIEAGEDPISICRVAYGRRLTETPGMLSTGDEEVVCSLNIVEQPVDLSHLNPMFKKMRQTFETPDGHPFSEAVDLWRHARELACGFFYRWVVQPPKPWLKARKDWCRFVRHTLSYSRRYHTPHHMVQGLEAGEINDVSTDEFDEFVTPYATWLAVRDVFKPQTEPVWVDDTVLNFANDWMASNRGIVWVEHRAFGRKLETLSGRPYYADDGLCKDGRSIEDEKESCIASIAANKEGRNLQRYNKGLVVSSPTSGKIWQQMVGRFHRSGQTADEVVFDLVLGCKEQGFSFWTAVDDAGYIEQTTGMAQKLLFASIAVRSRDEIEEEHSISKR